MMNALRMTAALASTALVGTMLATVGPAATAAQPDQVHARKAAYKPTLKASADEIVSGDELVLSGKVKHAAKGVEVIIQKKIDGRKWKVEERATTNKKGKFSYTDEPHAAGARKYRAVVPAQRGRAKGTSESVTVTVFRWQYLNAVRVRDRLYTFASNSVAINGVTYGHGFTGSPYSDNGFIDWNLNRDCTTLEVRLGASDDSDITATSHIEVQADGSALYSKDFALGQSEATTIDLTDVFRLGFTWTASNPAADPDTGRVGAVPAFVEAQVLCAF